MENKSFNSIELSIVIPTLGRETLIKTLQSLTLMPREPSWEVIVVGKISDVSIRQRMQEISVTLPYFTHLDVSFEKGDSSLKKNAGFNVGKGRIVAFLDDDVIVGEEWTKKIMEPFKDDSVGLISGPALIPEDVSFLARMAGLALASPAAGYVAFRYKKVEEVRKIVWSSIIGCNMAYRREVFKMMGGFDPSFWPGEEMLAAFRTQKLGYNILFNSGAVVYHYPRGSIKDFCRQIYGYGATRIRLMRAGVNWELSPLFPCIFLFLALFLCIAAVFSAWASLMFFLLLAAYLLLDSIFALLIFLQTRKIRDITILFMIPLMHASYGFGQWKELISPNKDFSIK